VVDGDAQLARGQGRQPLGQVDVGFDPQLGALLDGGADPAAQPLLGERGLLGPDAVPAAAERGEATAAKCSR
jgi:hypothetical protein